MSPRLYVFLAMCWPLWWASPFYQLPQSQKNWRTIHFIGDSQKLNHFSQCRLTTGSGNRLISDTSIFAVARKGFLRKLKRDRLQSKDTDGSAASQSGSDHHDPAEDEVNEEVTTLSYEELLVKWKSLGYDEESFDVQSALNVIYMNDMSGLNDDDDDGDDADENNLPIPLVTSKGGRKGRISQASEQKKMKESMKNTHIDSSSDSEITTRSVGIDLGTTYSAVSIIDPEGSGKPIIIPVDGQRITPSVVAYSMPSGLKEKLQPKILVGELARRQIVVNPDNSFASVKRVIGKSFEEAKEAMGLVHEKSRLRLIKKNHNSSSESPTCGLICPNLGKQLSAEEISAEVIKKLLIGAQDFLDSKVGKSVEGSTTNAPRISNAVITVPAYFLPEQCEATKRAGLLAGLEKVKLLREPEAAALAYGLTQRNPQIVLVFDLGGGTFDVSVLEVGGGFVEVIATSGDSHLGGDDFNAVIANWLLDQLGIQQNNSKDLANAVRKDVFAMSRLLDAAEQAKIALSSEQNVTIAVPFLLGDISLSPCILTKGKFESLSRKLLGRLLKPLREVAIMSGINLPGESGRMGIEEWSTDGDDDDDEPDKSSSRNSRDIQSSDRRLEIQTPEELSLSSLRQMQMSGRKLAKERQKVKGKSSSELRRLQKEMQDPRLSMFPGGQKLDDVLLVGGATRIPAVRRLVRIVTGVEPCSSAKVNPDEAVSLGAAVLAGILDGTVKDMQVMTAFQAAMYRAFAKPNNEEPGTQMK